MKPLFNRVVSKIKSFRTKSVIRKYEQTFEKDGHRLKYFYRPSKNSNKLAVMFSAFPGGEARAGYNMVTTFWNIKINKLYILDDFGYQKRGAYYLSQNGDFFIPPMVNELLTEYMKNKEKVCFLGSSKGGTAALYYGINHPGVDTIICGAPQYYIGDYLTCRPEHYPILDAMAGSHDKAAVEKYNLILPQSLAKCCEDKKPAIYIHYSNCEPTYPHHIRSLIRDLKKNHFSVTEDVQSYLWHHEVANYFPALCTKYLKNI